MEIFQSTAVFFKHYNVKVVSKINFFSVGNTARFVLNIFYSHGKERWCQKGEMSVKPSQGGVTMILEEGGSARALVKSKCRE